MKKFAKIFLLILFVITGCSNQSENKSWENKSALNVTEISLAYQEYFTDLSNYSHQKIFNIEEFSSYLNSIEIAPYVDLTKYSKYDESFFTSNFIFTSLIHNDSSSKKLIIESYSYNESLITLNIKEIAPENIATDIVTTIFLFEVPKNNLVTSDIKVDVNY